MQLVSLRLAESDDVSNRFIRQIVLHRLLVQVIGTSVVQWLVDEKWSDDEQ